VKDVEHDTVISTWQAPRKSNDSENKSQQLRRDNTLNK
jgi:hypothetical protein